MGSAWRDTESNVALVVKEDRDGHDEFISQAAA